MKILGALLELPAKQHCQSSLFTPELGQIGQICSAVKLVAPKGLPGFSIFLIGMGADYSFYVKSIATCAPRFFKHIISVLASAVWTVSSWHLLSAFLSWFKMVCGPFGQNNLHCSFDFRPDQPLEGIKCTKAK